MRTHDQELKRQRDNQAVLDQHLDDAEAHGMAKGMAKVIRLMRHKGLSLEDIEKITELSEEDLRNLLD